MTKIMLIAGEPSGDALGGRVVSALKNLDPTVECFGIGGVIMRDAGCDILFDANLIAVMGFIEVVKHFPIIKRAWNIALSALITKKPDVLILIDYPGFNLRFAKKAKALGIKVLYYVSPQIWAWHQSRIYKIKACVAHMVVLFPFEVPFYEKAGVPVSYFGCPIIENVAPQDKSDARGQLGLTHDAIVIGLLPGSRKSEISRLMPVLMDSAKALLSHYPKAQFLLPLANSLNDADLAPYLDAQLPLTLIKNNNHTAMAACDLLIGSSGTVTLEAAILGVPMLIIYKMNAITFELAKRLIKVKFIGLSNLLANKAITPELIQDQANAENIVCEAQKLLDNTDAATLCRQELAKVKAQLGEKGAARKVAQLALNMAHGD